MTEQILPFRVARAKPVLVVEKTKASKVEYALYFPASKRGEQAVEALMAEKFEGVRQAQTVSGFGNKSGGIQRVPVNQAFAESVKQEVEVLQGNEAVPGHTVHALKSVPSHVVEKFLEDRFGKIEPETGYVEGEYSRLPGENRSKPAIKAEKERLNRIRHLKEKFGDEEIDPKADLAQLEALLAEKQRKSGRNHAA